MPEWVRMTYGEVLGARTNICRGGGHLLISSISIPAKKSTSTKIIKILTDTDAGLIRHFTIAPIKTNYLQYFPLDPPLIESQVSAFADSS